MLSLHLLFIFTLTREFTAADYECLCNYNIQDAVYATPANENNRIGILYEFDCKPTYQFTSSTPQWQAIQYEKQVGYVALDDKTQVQTCPGEPSTDDLVVQSTTGKTSLSTSKSLVSSRSTLHPIPPDIATKFTTRPPSSTKQLIPTTKSGPQCPPQIPRSRFHIEFGQHCYEFILRVHKTWPDAERDCKSKGGYLVTISSKAEQDFIYNSVRQLHLHDGDLDVWTGLTDQRVEGSWEWSSGENATFMYWDSGEPKTSVFGSIEDCVMIEMDKNGHWGDVPCTGFLFSHQNHGYVCEYEKV